MKIIAFSSSFLVNLIHFINVHIKLYAEKAMGFSSVSLYISFLPPHLYLGRQKVGVAPN